MKHGTCSEFFEQSVTKMLDHYSIDCYLYFSSIGNLSAQSVAICGYLEPLSAVLFSVFMLNETMLPTQIMGTVMIFGGAILGRKVQISEPCMSRLRQEEKNLKSFSEKHPIKRREEEI